MKNRSAFSYDIEIFCPYTYEFLYDYVYSLSFTNNDLIERSPFIKSRVLIVLRKLLDLELIYIYDWIKKPNLNEVKLTTEEILNEINSIWFDGATYPDFYNMVMFGSQKWYIKKLENLGLTHTTDWEWFVENKIGNLEDWIKKNRP